MYRSKESTAHTAVFLCCGELVDRLITRQCLFAATHHDAGDAKQLVQLVAGGGVLDPQHAPSAPETEAPEKRIISMISSAELSISP